jgi:hemolysin activation/secretion protein
MRRDVFIAALRTAALLALSMPAAAPAAQSAADRADPSVIRRELFQERRTPAPGRGPIQVQPAGSPAAGAAGPAAAVLVGAIRVEGADDIAASRFADAIQPYLGRELAPADLARLASDVANVARRLGFGLATAEVPEQVVESGILKVVVDEGRIDAVEVTGNGAEPVRKLLLRLVNGRPVRTDALERQLLLAADLAGVSTDGARIERRDRRNILHVVAHRDPVAIRLGIDNWGSAPLGPVRARIDIDVNGLVAGDDRLSINGLVTPLQPGEFQFIRGAWSIPVDAGGTQIAIAGYYGHSRPGASLKSRDLEGDTIGADFTLSHPFLRRRAASLWGNVELSALDSDLEEQGLRSRRDRVRTISAGLDGVARIGGGWVRANVSVEQGVDALGATGRGDPLASRADAGGAFTKISFSARYAAPLGGRFSASLAMEGQLASRPLLSSEEMGLGGTSFLRGYDYWEVAGDQGVAGSAELRYDLGGLFRPLRKVQIYGYADAGTVGNLQNGPGGASLASAGGGVRFSLRDGLEAGAELGIPLRASPFTPSPAPRFSFSLGYGF